MGVTLKDIAQATGYSINTVSRALRDDRRISDEAKERIHGEAKRLRYIPNAIASAMRSIHTKSIGVVTADSANPFFSEVNKGIEAMAEKAGCHILVGSTEESLTREKNLVNLFLSRMVDGLVVMPVSDTSEEHLELYRSLPVPFVFAGRHLEGFDDHCILHDDVTGEKEVVRHLISHGHRQILVLTGPEQVSNTQDRLQGVREAYRDAGIPLEEAFIWATNGHAEEGYAAVNQALNKGLPFTAITCFNDLVAMGALKSLSENGLSCPRQVEVVGYDNLYMSQFMQPALTTVDVPKFRLGYAAMDSLITHIKNPSAAYGKVVMPTRLVFRESTRGGTY